MTTHLNAPPPDLRIVPTESVLPHEEHDSQRSIPLIEAIRKASVITNPPIVAQIDNTDQYVILDGANRCHSFGALNFPCILVQVVDYDSPFVDLMTWHHVVSDWQIEPFLDAVRALQDVSIIQEDIPNPLATLYMRDGQKIILSADVATTYERNALLRQFVRIYQQNAKLHRTVSASPEEIWRLYPHAIALVLFPTYTPDDIMSAAKYKAFLPPGISRHIIHGRALLVNYPIEALLDHSKTIDEKNADLQAWIQMRLANRKVRYYAETTYQFDE
ncbi:MAG: hypothetical protein CUN52_01575 [Phototrophicales bacterium]|nr:MAG: hypothetical protein CUN52_01575 [Phototrophicales bacterium]